MVSLNRPKTIAVNDAHRMAPWADMLYAADSAWWRHYHYVERFKGERWSQQKGDGGWAENAPHKGINLVTCHHSLDLSFDPTYINSGWNSSFQALNLAVLQGAKRVLLLGVDLHDRNGAHFFGEHPLAIRRSSPFATFRKAFERAAEQCREMGIEVINCSPDSALKCFPTMEVRDALCKRAPA